MKFNELENTVLVNHERLDTLEEDVSEIKEEVISLRPKRMGLKIGIPIIALILTILGGWGAFSSSMADKPSRGEVQEMLKPNSDALENIEKEQQNHKSILERLDQKLTDQSDLLKDIQSRIK